MSLWIHLKILNSSSLRDRRYFQQSLNLINDELISAGLPLYQYPFDVNFARIILPELDTSRSELTQLKYVAAMRYEDKSWTPPLNFNRFSSHQIPLDLKRKIASDNKSHLLCNYHGQYVPLDFGETILPPKFLESIGSSINLKNELELLSERLKIKLVERMPDAERFIEAIFPSLEDDPLLMSKIMIIRFYPIVIASIKHNLTICMD